MRMTTTSHSQIVDIQPDVQALDRDYPAEKDLELEKPDPAPLRQDAFGDEEHAEVKYKVLKWWYVPLLPGLLGLVCL